MLAESNIRSTVGDGLRDDRIDRGLTPSQKAYCYARADGFKPIDAYRRAYPNDTSMPTSLTTAAMKLEADPRIVQFTTDTQLERKRQTNLVPQEERIEITRDWVGQGIAKLAQDKTVKPQTRLSAYIAAGKLAGVDAFRDIVVHEKRTRTVEEIDAEIARHLANMIDVTPNASVNQTPVNAIEHEPVNPTPVKDRRRKPVV